MTTSRIQPPSINLKERIAALQQRSTPSNQRPTSPQPIPSAIGGNAVPTRALKDKIARFEKKGGVPVPRGSFGLGAPPIADGGPRRTGELYGNRIPTPLRAGLTTSASRSTSPLPVGAKTPTQQLSDTEFDMDVSPPSVSATLSPPGSPPSPPVLVEPTSSPLSTSVWLHDSPVSSRQKAFQAALAAAKNLEVRLQEAKQTQVDSTSHSPSQLDIPLPSHSAKHCDDGVTDERMGIDDEPRHSALFSHRREDDVRLEGNEEDVCLPGQTSTDPEQDILHTFVNSDQLIHHQSEDNSPIIPPQSLLSDYPARAEVGTSDLIKPVISVSSMGEDTESPPDETPRSPQPFSTAQDVSVASDAPAIIVEAPVPQCKTRLATDVSRPASPDPSPRSVGESLPSTQELSETDSKIMAEKSHTTEDEVPSTSLPSDDGMADPLAPPHGTMARNDNSVAQESVGNPSPKFKQSTLDIDGSNKPCRGSAHSLIEDGDVFLSTEIRPRHSTDSAARLAYDETPLGSPLTSPGFSDTFTTSSRAQSLIASGNGEILVAERVSPVTGRGVPVVFPSLQSPPLQEHDQIAPTRPKASSLFSHSHVPSSHYEELDLDLNNKASSSTFSAVVHGKVTERSSLMASARRPPETPKRIRDSTMSDLFSPGIGELSKLVEEAVLLEQRLLEGELPSELPHEESSSAPTPIIKEPDEHHTPTLTSPTSQPETHRRTPSFHMFKVSLTRNKSTRQSAFIPSSPPKESSHIRAQSSLIPGNSYPHHPIAPQAIVEEADVPGSTDVPPTPPPKSPAYFSSFRKLSSAGRKWPSMPGAYPRDSVSIASEPSSEDSIAVITPPDNAVDFTNKVKDSIEQSAPNVTEFGANNNGLARAGTVGPGTSVSGARVPWPSLSPKKSGSFSRAASFAGKMWQRARTKSSGSTLSTSDAVYHSSEDAYPMPILEHTTTSTTPSIDEQGRLQPPETRAPKLSVTLRPESWISVSSTGSSSLASPLLDAFPSVPQAMPPRSLIGAERFHQSQLSAHASVSSAHSPSTNSEDTPTLVNSHSDSQLTSASSFPRSSRRPATTNGNLPLNSGFQ